MCPLIEFSFLVLRKGEGARIRGIESLGAQAWSLLRLCSLFHLSTRTWSCGIEGHVLSCPSIGINKFFGAPKRWMYHEMHCNHSFAMLRPFWCPFGGMHSGGESRLAEAGVILDSGRAASSPHAEASSLAPVSDRARHELGSYPRAPKRMRRATLVSIWILLGYTVS